MAAERVVIRGMIAATALAASIACGPETGRRVEYGPWEGTTLVEENVAIVRNLSGAVWGGPALLTPELSIGVEDGADEYMLGWVRGIATDGSRILVVDASIPVIRAYDAAGVHLEDWGRRGQGPGEFLAPSTIDRGPDGTFYVLDQGQYRIVSFGPAGRPLTDLKLATGSKTNQPIVAAGGRVWWHSVVDRTQTGETSWGYRGYAVGQPVVSRLAPMIDFTPEVVIGPGPPCVTWPVPYAAQYVSTMLSDGSIAAGTGESYRVLVDQSDGRRRILERPWEPIPLAPGQRAWRRRYENAFARYACGAGWSWRGPDLPRAYPAFQSMVATQSGQLWVIRQVGSERVPDKRCDADPALDGSRPGPPCWLDRREVDAFDAVGRYLGEVILPADLHWDSLRGAWIDSDSVFAAVTDERGVVQVRKYRIHRSER